MRPVGRFVGEVLSSLREFARIGMTTNDLDAHARELIAKAGARSVYLGYHPSFGGGYHPSFGGGGFHPSSSFSGGGFHPSFHSGGGFRGGGGRRR